MQSVVAACCAVPVHTAVGLRESSTPAEHVTLNRQGDLMANIEFLLLFFFSYFWYNSGSFKSINKHFIIFCILQWIPFCSFNSRISTIKALLGLNQDDITVSPLLQIINMFTCLKLYFVKTPTPTAETGNNKGNTVSED
ncbi:hypothetical protein XENORESO_004351 [Xenotaenia resolanae]|uniref:Uncharacterized protein n=1 Tax=Xenotaenia resolanae TaxID=208358 RepID=A0ABV0W0Z7_9TELE